MKKLLERKKTIAGILVAILGAVGFVLAPEISTEIASICEVLVDSANTLTE